MWKKDFGLLDSGWFYDAGFQWGFGASPTIYKDTVILQCDVQDESFVAAYKLADGKEVWRTTREEIPGWSSPTVHEFGDMPMLLTHGTKAARAYDARDGQLLWTLSNHSEIVVPTPFVAHNLIYIASGYQPIQPIYAIKPEARGDITPPGDSTTNESIEWGYKRGGPYMPSPIVYGDYFYVCANSGILTCQDAKTGKRIYKKRMSAPGGSLSFTASPLAADGHLYLPAEDGRVLVVKAGPEFELVETNEAGESILATPAISDGTIYLRTNKHLIAVGE
jgi:outer membrane protein assembly factor BamB